MSEGSANGKNMERGSSVVMRETRLEEGWEAGIGRVRVYMECLMGLGAMVGYGATGARSREMGRGE